MLLKKFCERRRRQRLIILVLDCLSSSRLDKPEVYPEVKKISEWHLRFHPNRGEGIVENGTRYALQVVSLTEIRYLFSKQL